jgi:serine/threonine-protein kinase
MVRPVTKHRTGEVVGGRYKIVNLLGEGGQGAVYRAVDLRAGDEIALKVLRAGAERESTERMFREAQAMASLHGSAAVRVMDQVWTDDGCMCLVTELLHGQPLDDVLEAAEKNGAKADVGALVRLLEPVVHTLQRAHDNGIVHRDLKPANIFVLENDGGVRLLDFGFVKFTRLRGLTGDGMIAGSPSYIAPEAWLGRHEAIDHRIDVYGLGAVLFRSLAGHPPFASTDLGKLLRDVTSAKRPSLREVRPDLHPDIDEWVMLALAVHPEERFQSVTALWRAFRTVAGM